MLTPKKETANIQTPTSEINSKPPKIQSGILAYKYPYKTIVLASPNSEKKKNTSKMKKHRNHSQLKQQENSPKAVNNDTDLCSLSDIEFKREIVKILKELSLNIKELREDMNSNTESLRKELENIRRKQEKLENSFAEIQTELKAIKTRMKCRGTN